MNLFWKNQSTNIVLMIGNVYFWNEMVIFLVFKPVSLVSSLFGERFTKLHENLTRKSYEFQLMFVIDYNYLN